MTDTLTRKVTGSEKGSLIITIPSQLAQMCGIVKGDTMKFEYLGPGQFKIEKVEES